jgi:nucleoside-diphosphate-sugar epimerase
MTILITGASGFVGRHVVAALVQRSIKTRVVCRPATEYHFHDHNIEVTRLTGLGTAAQDWVDVVDQCDAVIHLAARAHVIRGLDKDTILSFRAANVDFTRACAEAAARAGVRRFIFLSSVGVHGGLSESQPFHAESAFKPHTPYAFSKAEAEQALSDVAHGSNLEVTVVRPPLVYGAGAPGNFARLVRAIERGWPLPFGLADKNLRSFVAIDNLVSLVMTCIDHPAAANRAFLVSDAEDLSTMDLLRRLGTAMRKPARLLPIPLGLLALGANLIGKRELFQSLCGSLQVDISATQELLDWKPLISVDEGLSRAVRQRL